jgi:hypothetical protein
MKPYAAQGFVTKKEKLSLAENLAPAGNDRKRRDDLFLGDETLESADGRAPRIIASEGRNKDIGNDPADSSEHRLADLPRLEGPVSESFIAEGINVLPSPGEAGESPNDDGAKKNYGPGAFDKGDGFIVDIPENVFRARSFIGGKLADETRSVRFKERPENECVNKD